MTLTQRVVTTFRNWVDRIGKNREWTIFRVKLGSDMMSHEFIWAKRTKTPKGIGYHVTAKPRAMAHSRMTGEFFNGLFLIINQPKPNEAMGRKFAIKEMYPVGYLGKVGFAMWSAMTVGDMVEGDSCDFSYNIPKSSCITWTKRASVKAAMWTLFPL